MRLLGVLVLMLSTSVFACPDLAGKYSSCRPIKGGEATYTNIEISQTVENDVTVYSVTYYEPTQEPTIYTYEANGKLMTTLQWNPTQQSSFSMDTLTICSGDALHANQFSFANETEIGRMETIIKKENNSLMVELTGHIMGIPFSDKVICE